ncbi:MULTISPECIES: hypothetical protein [Streptosporangiaceae]|uniref:hypothetical protein n=1 Tax=Streptosporangiaceae TaxID=2004 RepID=UPI0033DC0D7B
MSQQDDEPRLNIRMQAALDSLPAERMEPHGGWAFDPDAEWQRETDHAAQCMMQDWLTETLASNPGPVRIRVPGTDGLPDTVISWEAQ